MSLSGIFGTDIAPPCTCGSTICAYELVSGDTVVRTKCCGCHAVDYFRPKTTPTTATEFRKAHEAERERRTGLPPFPGRVPDDPALAAKKAKDTRKQRWTRRHPKKD